MVEKKKTYEEAKKEAIAKMLKNKEKKKRTKLGEGYKYYILTDDSLSAISPRKMYFRHLKSAQQWLDKHPYSKHVYAVSDDSIVFTRSK